MEGLQASKSMLFLASGKERKGDYWTLQLTTPKKLYYAQPHSWEKENCTIGSHWGSLWNPADPSVNEFGASRMACHKMGSYSNDDSMKP